MPARKSAPRDVACLRIGFIDYLLEPDKAMQVLKLLRGSLECDRQFSNGGYRYRVKERPELELTIIDPSQIDMPVEQLQLEDRRR